MLGFLGFGVAGSTLLSLRIDAFSLRIKSPGGVGYWEHPHAHVNTPAFRRQSLYSLRFKIQAAHFPFNLRSSPTLPSVGPDTEKQRFPSSLAVKIPCALPLRHSTEGRIIGEIISLLLNEALLPQLPVSPLRFRRQ